jgi:signal transduction histidine kinase
LADSNASADDLRAMGEALRETIDRSEALIAALLTLARSETISGREEDVDLAALAGDCITDLLARSQGAGLTVHDDLRLAPVRGDSALLERMVGNLLENGIRHNVNGGELNVRTRTDGRDTTLVVSNSGAVITQEQADTLTEPFRRLSRTPGGFGLGLSIVRSVATAHRGSVVVTALEQGGLEVCVTLPGSSNARNQVKPRRQRSLTKS